MSQIFCCQIQLKRSNSFVDLSHHAYHAQQSRMTHATIDWAALTPP
jgi:hypothetical protein